MVRDLIDIFNGNPSVFKLGRHSEAFIALIERDRAPMSPIWKLYAFLSEMMAGFGLLEIL
ncbi:MAG: hypothetical protein ACXWWG_02870 [Nitrospira sp.]